MSDNIAVVCFCGKPIAVENRYGGAVYRHEVAGATEELIIVDFGQAEMKDEVTMWILEIHGELHSQGTRGESLRPAKVQYRFPYGACKEEIL